MTYEIARTMQQHPEIADYALLFQHRMKSREWLSDLGESSPGALTTVSPGARLVGITRHLLGTYVPGVASIYQAQRSHGLRRELRQFRGGLEGVTSLPLVYHEPNMILSPFDGPSVATLNDLSWHHDPTLHPIERIRWIERNLPKTLRRASRFIAISEFTRAEAVRVLGVARDRVDVVHLAPAAHFQPMAAAVAAPTLGTFGLSDRSYVLSVSTLEPRKNFDRLLAAYLQLPEPLRRRMPLVIVGGKGWGTVLDRPDATRAAAAGQLRLLGHVTDEVLVALTARCATFAYVSLYEGFGLPVVEAMATGAPVLASATTATGETAGDAALLVDPMDVDAIRDGLHRMLAEPDDRATYAEASLRRAAQFSWRRTVDGMARSWRQVAS